MKIEVNNSCFICKNKKHSVIHITKYPEFNYPGNFVLNCCSECQLLFNSPRLNNKELENLYQNNYYFFNRDDEKEFARVIHMYNRLIPQVINYSNAKQVIEIGSAKGYFLALLARLGWDVKGVEISKAASDYANQHFKVNTFCGDSKSYVLSYNYKHPLAFAIDLIEHVPDPKQFLKDIHQIIDSKGILVIDTPNANSKNIAVRKKMWSGFNPFHIFLFSPNNIKILLKQTGFEICSIYTYNNDVLPITLKDIIVHILRKTGVNKLKGAFRFQPVNRTEYDLSALISKSISQIKNPTEMPDLDFKELKGDNLVVIARKLG